MQIAGEGAGVGAWPHCPGHVSPLPLSLPTLPCCSPHSAPLPCSCPHPAGGWGCSSGHHRHVVMVVVVMVVMVILVVAVMLVVIFIITAVWWWWCLSPPPPHCGLPLLLPLIVPSCCSLSPPHKQLLTAVIGGAVMVPLSPPTPAPCPHLISLSPSPSCPPSLSLWCGGHGGHPLSLPLAIPYHCCLVPPCEQWLTAVAGGGWPCGLGQYFTLPPIIQADFAWTH